jgi:hypothetical protein
MRTTEIDLTPESVNRRQRLPTRRASVAFNFEHEGHRYRATATHFADGRLAEIFLDTGKINTPLQQNAETSAILPRIFSAITV